MSAVEEVKARLDADLEATEDRWALSGGKAHLAKERSALEDLIARLEAEERINALARAVAEAHVAVLSAPLGTYGHVRALGDATFAYTTATRCDCGERRPCAEHPKESTDGQ